MQNYGARVAAIDDELTELRKRVTKVHARIGVVEDEIEEVQHALRDLDLPSPAVAAGVNKQDREQTRAWLRQEKVRLGSREDMIRQENTQLIQLQLRLLETRMQVQANAGLSRDIELGEVDKTLQAELVDHLEYLGAVRLLPPCLILLFLTALAAWFGFDLLHNQPGLTTTQKVASIGSATFTVMTIVALFVRAAMCTGEWQWTLHTCYCVTGWCWLKPRVCHRQQQPQQQQHRRQHSDAGSYVLEKAGSIPQPSPSEAASADNYHKEDDASSLDSMDGSEIEVNKKLS